MVDIIVKKPYERFDWKAKLKQMSVTEARDWQRREYARCATDKIYWCNQYVWTINTAKKPSIVPFILYDYQLEFIAELDKFIDIFIEKSRQMGISWTVMMWELHNVCYTRGFSALNISKKGDDVQDKGNTFHALMGRLNFMWERLPQFLRPRIVNPMFTFMVPSMNSVIKGDTANENAGRDTNFKFIFVDEAAHIKIFDKMWKAMRQSSDAICINSTPPKEIVNNKYVEIKDKKNSGFKKMRFHWKQHPEKDQDWFNKKTASMEEADIAQELEIGYDKAQTNRSYPEYNENVHLTGSKIYYNHHLPLNVFMDFGLDGEVFLFNQIDKNKRMFIIKYKIYHNLLTYELYKHFIEDIHELGFRGDISDIFFVGDVAGTKRNRATKTSVIKEYFDVSNGKISINSQYLTNEDKMIAVRYSLKRLINGLSQINVSREASCLKFSECMKYITFNKKRDDHVDNKYTHAVNAFEYGINWFFPHKMNRPFMMGIDLSDDTRTMMAGGTDNRIITYLDNDFSIKQLDNDSNDERSNENTSASYSINSILNNNKINRRSLIWR